MSFNTWGSVKECPPHLAKTYGTRYDRKAFGIVNSTILSRIGKLCGEYMMNANLPVEAFANICPWTKNIRELSLSDCADKRRCQCEAAWPVVVNHLLPQCGNIRKIRFSFTFKRNVEKDMEELFCQMKKLKSITVRLYCGMHSTYHCLEKLSFQTVEEIVLMGFLLINDSGHLLSSKIRESTKLQKFRLHNVADTVAMENIFEALAFQAENLTSLNFFISIDGLSSRTLSNFSRLENLKSLFITATYRAKITDTFLAAIVSSCKQLTHLTLKNVMLGDPMDNLLTDDGISSLVNLPELKFLYLERLGIRKPALERMHNLEILGVSTCRLLEEQALCDFLKKAHNLRVIIVDGRDVTGTLLRVAIETQRIRKSNTVLEIVLPKNCFKLVCRNPRLLHVYYGRCDPRFSPSIYWVESEEENKWREKEVLYVGRKSRLNYSY